MAAMAASLSRRRGRLASGRARSRALRAVGLIGVGVVMLSADGRARFSNPADPSLVQSASAPAQARVRLEILGTASQGRTGDGRAEARAVLELRSGARRFLAAGGPSVADICQVGVIDTPTSIVAAHVWRLDAALLDVSPSQTTLDLQWTRFRGNPGQGVAEAGDRRTVTLAPGEYHVFDFVAAPPGSSSCANVVLRLLADPLPAFEPQPAIAVDLWLSHEAGAGTRFTHRRVTGRAGEPLAFRLDPLRWSPAGAPLPATDSGPAVGLDVSGTIQAVLGPDGFLDASVRVTRRLSWGQGWVQGEGLQEFRCAPGEAVAMLLPDPKGRAALPASAGLALPVAAGVSVEAANAVVDFGQFFAGTQGSLYVVIRPER